MKRCLLTIAILVAVNCGLASADYVIVKMDLNYVLYPPQPQQPGGPQGFKQGGNMPPGGGQFPPGGFPPGKGGKGAKGGKGGFIPPPPVQPMPQFGQNGQLAPSRPMMPPLYIHAYVEGRASLFSQANNQKNVAFDIFEVDFMYGKQLMPLWAPGQPGPGEVVLAGQGDTLAKRFSKQMKDDLKGGTEDSKKQKLVTHAQRFLRVGLLTEFDKCIDDLGKLDAKDPVVVAVLKTREDLKKKPAANDPAAQALADELKDEYRPMVSKKGHYTLLTNIKGQDAELEKKLEKLEAVYSTFFCWHALRGQPLTPPAYRLVIVLIDTPNNSTKDFKTKHQAFNFPELVGSGFMAQRDNVIVMTSRRMDDVYESLENYNQEQWQKYTTNLIELLTNPAKWKGIAQGNPNGIKEIAVLQALALCQKSMSDENETLTLTHQAARQLVAATGIMPGNVLTAEWARAGLASLFEVPEQSFYPCNAGPSWQHLVEFKYLRKAKKLDKKDAREILFRVVTDDYLHQAQKTLGQAMLYKEDYAFYKVQADEELALARATAWSLMYFLVQKKDAKDQRALQRYFEEIHSLPRDLEYNELVLWNCFCRAFGLLSQDPQNPNRLVQDIGKIEALATAWFTEMDGTFLDFNEEKAIQWRDPARQPGGGQPGPGGFPPKY